MSKGMKRSGIYIASGRPRTLLETARLFTKNEREAQRLVKKTRERMTKVFAQLETERRQ